MNPSQVSVFLKKMASNIEAAKNPRKELVIKDLKRILAAVDGEGVAETGAAPTSDQKKIEQALFGRTKPFVYTQTDDTKDEDLAGSALFWAAFEALDMVDWTPLTDPQPVFDKVRELALPDYAEDGVKEAQANWADYQQNYMPEQIEKLKSLGLM